MRNSYYDIKIHQLRIYLSNVLFNHLFHYRDGMPFNLDSFGPRGGQWDRADRQGRGGRWSNDQWGADRRGDRQWGNDRWGNDRPGQWGNDRRGGFARDQFM